MTLTRVQEISERLKASTPLGPECSEKTYLFSNDGDLVATMRGNTSSPDYLAYMAKNYDLYRNAPADLEYLLDQLKRTQEALGVARRK